MRLRGYLARAAWLAALPLLLFDDHPAPLWVLARDSLRVLDVNQAAVDRFGHRRERFLAFSAADLVAPEERSRLDELAASAQPGDAMAARRHACPPAMRPISHLGQPALLVRLRELPAATGKAPQEPARP